MRKAEVVYGIDFSGAKTAGKSIWIAKATPGDKGILITGCFSAKDLLGLATPNREAVLPGLVEFVAGTPNAAFGCDFPFSLPSHLVGQPTWRDFLEAYPQRFPSPEAFRQHCTQRNLARCGKKEVRRETERMWKKAMPVNNLRMYKMTHFGIGSFLRPLVLDYGSSVPPLTGENSEGPLILEVFPTGTGLDTGLGVPKHNSSKALGELERQGRVRFSGAGIQDAVLNGGGDAVDSVVAADAAYRAVCDPARIDASQQWPYTLEGYIFG